MTERGACAALDSALAAAARGWKVAPVKPATKAAAIRDWPDRASDDPDVIRRWWTRWPDANAAAACGPSGLIVVDVDGAAGRASLDVAEAELGPLPPTLTVATPRGEHRYFRDPGGICMARGWRPGLDVLAGRHAVMLPGSVVDATAYTLLDAEAITDAGLAELPPAWVDALGKASKPITPLASSHHGPIGTIPNGANGVTDRLAEVFRRERLTQRGTAHRLLFRLARHTRAIFPTETQPPAVVIEGLQRWHTAGREHTEKAWPEVLGGFLDAWHRIDPDRDGLTQAMRAADAVGCHPAVAAAFPDADSAGMRRLAALLGELQRKAGSAAFFLSQADAGRVLGGAPRQRIASELSLMRRLGWLTRTSDGRYSEGKASEYRWHPDRPQPN